MKKYWETIVDFTKIRKGGVPIVEVLAALEKAEKKRRKRKIVTERNG